MSIKIKTGWLSDKGGDRFAPKTLTTQVQTPDGVLLDDAIEAALTDLGDTLREELKVEVDSELSSTSENPIQNKVINAELDAISVGMAALEAAIDEKTIQADWGENDETAAGYIKNRICYEYEGWETAFEGTLEVNEDPMASGFHPDLPYCYYMNTGYIKTGETVKLNIGNLTMGWEAEGGNYGIGEGEYSIGNTRIGIMASSGSAGIMIFELYCQTDISGQTWSIQRYVKSVKTIDEKYLPEYFETVSYCTSSTAADTAIKEASCSVGKYVLEKGRKVIVKFSTANTAANPRLNIGGTGSKYIYLNGVRLPSSQYWDAGAVLEFVYDGSGYNLIGAVRDNDTVYEVATSESDGLLSAADKVKLDSMDAEHDHDERYYTEAEVDVLLEGKAESSHSHDSVYDSKGAASVALSSARDYVDGKVSSLASENYVSTSLSSHDVSSVAHSDIRDLISGLTSRLNAVADSDDETLDQLSEIVSYIKSNRDLISSITTDKVSVSDIIDNLVTNVSTKPLSAAQGVAIKSLIDALSAVVDGKAAISHAHAISDVSGLMTSLDGKSNVGHGHKVSEISDLSVSAKEINYMSGVTSGIQAQLDGKAEGEHSHAISDVNGLSDALSEKVSVTRSINGKALSSDVILSASDVGADSLGSAGSALSSAKVYADSLAETKSLVQIIEWEDGD